MEEKREKEVRAEDKTAEAEGVEAARRRGGVRHAEDKLLFFKEPLQGIWSYA